MKSSCHEATEDESEHHWVTVRNFLSLEQANDHALVALAMGQGCRVIHDSHSEGYCLETDNIPSVRLQQEWQAYEQENQDNSFCSNRDLRDRSSQRWWSFIWWMIAVMSAFWWQHRSPELAHHFVSSSIDLVEKHEWWRPFTALFLHADLGHLMGNILTALLFTPFVSRQFGAWRGWGWILLCGAIGNAINAYFSYPQSFSSLGSSTAIFAALGLLTASGVIDLWLARPRPTVSRLGTPLCAGIALLGFLGNSPDPLTDVAGHVCGFISGLVIGMILQALQRLSKTENLD